MREPKMEPRTCGARGGMVSRVWCCGSEGGMQESGRAGTFIQ